MPGCLVVTVVTLARHTGQTRDTGYGPKLGMTLPPTTKMLVGWVRITVWKKVILSI
jgi:hypothetical protein